MANYFKTDTGYGYTEGDDPIPSASVAITEAEYNALVEAAAQKLRDAEAEYRAGLNAKWTKVHDALVGVGLDAGAAELLANTVGLKPEA